MATPSGPQFIPSTIDTFILNTTLADYGSKLVDNAYNSNVELKLLNQYKDLKDGGGSIVEPLIESEQNDGGFYAGGDVLNSNQTNSLTMVEYKWQNAYEPIQLTRDEERSNSGSEHKILDLVATKTMLSEKAIAKRMSQGISVPVANAGNLIDLTSLVGTGTLGSIAGATDTFWQATSVTSGAFATQGLTDMNTAYYAVSSGSNEDNPTHIINGDLSANAGFKNLTFKGTPIMYGNFISSGVMYMLNMNYVKLVVDSATDMITTPFIQPTNQMVRVAYILWRGNLITNNRRRQAKLISIT
jgi:hypothetical protein